MTIELSLKTCTQTVVYIEGESYYSFQALKKNWELNVRLKPLPTMLNTKHKVKEHLTTVAEFQLLSSTQRELCVQVYKD